MFAGRISSHELGESPERGEAAPASGNTGGGCFRKEHNMERFNEPQLALAGEAQDVILGSLEFGNDMQGEMLTIDMEFASDSIESLA